MKKILSFLLLSFTCILPASLFSQARFIPGYIISYQQDTTFGYINGRSESLNFRKCEFRRDKDDESVFFKPGSIPAYRFTEGKYYVSRIIGDSDTIFVEYLVNGIADLYYYRDFEGAHYLIEKDSKLVEMSNYGDVFYDRNKDTLLTSSGKRTGMLNYFFSDCMQVQPEIESVNFSHSSLIKLTKDYHKYVCKDEECIVYEKKLPAVRLGIAPVIGYYFSTFTIKDDPYFDDFDYENDQYPVFGISLSLNAPRSSESIFLQLEGVYGQFSTSTYKAYIFGGFRKEYHTMTIDFSFIKMLIPLRYSFPTGRLRPEVMLGGGFMRTFNPVVTQNIEVEYGGVIFDNEYAKPEVDPWFGCGFVRAGLSYNFNKRRSLFLNIGYEMSAGWTNMYGSYMKSFNIQGGFYF